jgi:regulator of PEP synthase PpsR (kinase-PPPase family)
MGAERSWPRLAIRHGLGQYGCGFVPGGLTTALSQGYSQTLATNRFHLHLVSDSTGETISSVARACVVQFSGYEANTHLWWLVRNRHQVDNVIEGVKAEPGLVLATLVDPEVRIALEEGCRQLRVPCVPVLDPVMAALANYLNAEFGMEPGRQHILDAEYFKRIDAMHFTLAHDDGQLLDDVDEADVIVIGVSRTSKTPTCMYLANRGIKAANVPIIPDQPLPREVLEAKRPLIVGLTREPKSLVDVRRARLQFLDRDVPGYADPDQVRDEVTSARRLFTERGWPVIDMTRRSIEEAAASILQFYSQRPVIKPGVS